MSTLSVVSTRDDLRRQVQLWRSQGETIGFVPTMGYLHQGHLSLIQLAHQHVDRVIVSIYVNPTQFGPDEDLDQYPRDPQGDLDKIEQAGAHLLFYPKTDTMYPEGAQTFVEVTKLAQPLCGEHRPVHFRGVATVVTKLFHLIQPDVAVFGEKDYQQLAIIQQLVRDLLMDVTILGGPIVREPDGLAMSSRNAYLSPEHRQAATCLNQAMREVRRLFSEGERDPTRLLQAATQRIQRESEARIQYVELRDAKELVEVNNTAQPDDRIFLAVFFGQTRLIDNAPLSGPCGL